MTTKELIFFEINTLGEEYLDELHKVIKAFTHVKIQKKKMSVMAKLRQIHIDAPEDFATNLESSPIVNDTRKVRRFISESFNNDHNKYIDYLLSQKKKVKIASEITSSDLLIQPKQPKVRKRRLEEFRGFLKHQGKPLSDEQLCAPVDYMEAK